MPNLQQQIAQCLTKCAYSRSSDDALSALNDAGLYIFQQVLKETSGYFLKFDTTSVVFVPGQQTYTLPADCDQIVHLAERATSSSPWLEMDVEGLSESLDAAQSQVNWWDVYGQGYGTSAFSYYGPYLTADVVAVSPQVQSINVSPAIDVVRQVEIAYTAKWMPILNANGTVFLPDEAQPAMTSMATAELLRMNDDSLAAEYEARGQRQLTSFLTQVRARQIQHSPQIKPYLAGY